MATAALTLTHDDVTPAIQRLVKLGQNTEPVMRSMGNAFLSITKGNFNSVGASMRPIPWKAKRDGTPSNLQLTTLLSKSFHLTVTSQTATLQNPTPYAAIHQFGGIILPKKGKALKFQIAGRWITVKKVTIPARPFYPVLNGRLAPAAEQRIARAGAWAVARLMNGSA